jgi:hypothetical protein
LDTEDYSLQVNGLLKNNIYKNMNKGPTEAVVHKNSYLLKMSLLRRSANNSGTKVKASQGVRFPEDPQGKNSVETQCEHH